MGEDLGDEFAGYIFRISGGNDKQGFAMKQGILSNGRVRLLLREGTSCYRTRRDGERKRKSVRGCIVGPDLSVVNLVVRKKGNSEIEGLTDTSSPKRLGPKRANKLRALFNLGAEDDVRKHVITRAFKTKITLKRKAAREATKLANLQQSRADRATYAVLLQKRMAEQKEARRSEISKRRSSRKGSSRKE
eukprot:GSChrysophyteH1.ASY1.ANO1.872.1 assembled CDS